MTITSPSEKAYAAAEVKEVAFEERQHVLGEIGSLERARGKTFNLREAPYEPRALGHALDPRHPSILRAQHRLLS